MRNNYLSHLPPDRVAFNVEETAELLGLCRGTIHKLISSGALSSQRIGRARRITRHALNAYLNENARQEIARMTLTRAN